MQCSTHHMVHMNTNSHVLTRGWICFTLGQPILCVRGAECEVENGKKASMDYDSMMSTLILYLLANSFTPSKCHCNKDCV